MRYRRLGKTGLEVSEVSLGTWQVGGVWGSGFDDANAERILEDAIEYDPPLGRLGELLGTPIVAGQLTRLFEFRHRVTREDVTALEKGDEDGVELSPDELGLSIYDGVVIELRETLHEQVMLALPAHPLCCPECKGLCPHCGADLNVTPCDCKTESFNSKFAALKNFKADD